MRFYTQQHSFYRGVDLHARTMYVCILSSEGKTVIERNIPTRPERFLKLIAPYRQGLVIGVECMFSWYWLADLCAQEDIGGVDANGHIMVAVSTKAGYRTAGLPEGFTEHGMGIMKTGVALLIGPIAANERTEEQESGIDKVTHEPDRQR